MIYMYCTLHMIGAVLSVREIGLKSKRTERKALCYDMYVHVHVYRYHML